MRKSNGELSVRDGNRKVGGPVAAEVHGTAKGWMGAAGQVVLLVHGFNNNFDEAQKAYLSFREHLPASGTWYLGEVQWPGDADFGFVQWLDFLSYPTEIPDARESAERLAAYLSQVARINPALELTLVGHSLGCRLILEMLGRFESGASKPAPFIRRILLMAAAVPTALSEPGKRLQKAGAQARERLVLFSPDDIVLGLAFPAGQSLARLLKYEDHFYFEAVGLNGHPESFASEKPLQACGNGHSDYWKDEDAASYLAQKMGAAVSNRLKERCLPKHETPAANELPSGTLHTYEIGSY